MTATTPFVSDRTWPPPARPWQLAMRWEHLLFLHWRVDPAALRARVPAGLELDLDDGAAYVGVVPFLMSNTRPRGVPGLPWLSRFPELNVRTYVTRGGKPGVWFFSLDAANPVAVRVARARFHLNYLDARMRCEARGHDGDQVVDYASTRHDRRAPPAELRVHWRADGPLQHARAGTLDHFLTARYALYSQSPDGRLWRGEIDHPPWPLRAAHATVACNTMLAAHGLAPIDAAPPLARCVESIDVVAWKLDPA